MPTLRLLCWNVHLLPWGYSRDRRERAGAVAQVVREERPDVVLLQEVWLPADADYLERALPGYACFGDTGHIPAVDPAIPFAGLAALPYSLLRPWRRAGLLTLVRADGPWRAEAEQFVEFEHEASDWAFWEQDGKADKGMQRLRLVHASGLRMDVINTHLQAEYDDPLAYVEVRKAQIGELSAFAERESGDLPVVCGGDFNTAAPVPGDDFDREAYEHLTRAHGWRDLTAPRREACLAEEPIPFWRCQTYVRPGGGRADWIDFVLTRRGDPVEIRALRVLANEEPDRPWSDHHGLLAQLEIRRGAESRLPLALALGAEAARRPLGRRALLGLGGLALAELLAPFATE